MSKATNEHGESEYTALDCGANYYAEVPLTCMGLPSNMPHSVPSLPRNDR